jgi:hypothetical protein
MFCFPCRRIGADWNLIMRELAEWNKILTNNYDILNN